jgi:hypothetical protein
MLARRNLSMLRVLFSTISWHAAPSYVKSDPHKRGVPLRSALMVNARPSVSDDASTGVALGHIDHGSFNHSDLACYLF